MRLCFGRGVEETAEWGGVSMGAWGLGREGGRLRGRGREQGQADACGWPPHVMESKDYDKKVNYPKMGPPHRFPPSLLFPELFPLSLKLLAAVVKSLALIGLTIDHRRSWEEAPCPGVTWQVI